jgi:Flp pilus assembly protein TadD
MRLMFNCMSAACAASALLACTSVGVAPGRNPDAGADAASSPRMVAGKLDAAADQAYLRGRTHHLAGDAQQAIEAYQAALASERGHVNARNGLASVYAEQGRIDEAIALWRTLTEAPQVGQDARSAFLFSNLGHAYALNGQYAQAVAALERACLLDPFHHRAWQQLGSALDQLGQADRAQAMYRQAASLEAHDVRRDYALAGAGASAALGPALEHAPTVAEPDPVQSGHTSLISSEVRELSNGMFELRRGGPAPSAPLQTRVLALRRATLEISNGNGVAGMARALARNMVQPGMRVVRVSNQKRFVVARTRVEYRGDFQLSAVLLAERFGADAVLVAGPAPLTDLRLVIGRDLINNKLAARAMTRPSLVSAATRNNLEAEHIGKAG